MIFVFVFFFGNVVSDRLGLVVMCVVVVVGGGGRLRLKNAVFSVTELAVHKTMFALLNMRLIQNDKQGNDLQGCFCIESLCDVLSFRLLSLFIHFFFF